MEPIFGSEDFRQFGYCPRKIYFRWVLQKTFPYTAKMKRGEKKHGQAVDKQNKQMKKEEKNPEQIGQDKLAHYRYREVQLEDPQLRIVAKIDLLEINDAKTIHGVITELKTSRAPKEIEYSHLMQLGAQGLVAERQLGIQIDGLRAHYLLDNIEYTVEFTDLIRSQVMEILNTMTEIVIQETIPEPTPYEERCRDCECWRVCQRA